MRSLAESGTFGNWSKEPGEIIKEVQSKVSSQSNMVILWWDLGRGLGESKRFFKVKECRNLSRGDVIGNSFAGGWGEEVVSAEHKEEVGVAGGVRHKRGKEIGKLEIVKCSLE